MLDCRRFMHFESVAAGHARYVYVHKVGKGDSGCFILDAKTSV